VEKFTVPEDPDSGTSIKRNPSATKKISVACSSMLGYLSQGGRYRAEGCMALG